MPNFDACINRQRMDHELAATIDERDRTMSSDFSARTMKKRMDSSGHLGQNGETRSIDARRVDLAHQPGLTTDLDFPKKCRHFDDVNRKHFVGARVTHKAFSPRRTFRNFNPLP